MTSKGAVIGFVPGNSLQIKNPGHDQERAAYYSHDCSDSFAVRLALTKGKFNFKFCFTLRDWLNKAVTFISFVT